MLILKSRIYLVYNTFCEAHFVQADNLFPIVPNINAIEDEPNNILISLPYKKAYKLKDINFTEDELAEAQKVGDYFLIEDEGGVSRKIKFLKLTNMLSALDSTKGRSRKSSFFS